MGWACAGPRRNDTCQCEGSVCDECRAHASTHLAEFLHIYMAMLVLRITIMWFPNLNPYRQPFYSMMQLTDPYLNLFRGWMPPIFGIDLSVILAFVVIQAVIDTLTISPF